MPRFFISYRRESGSPYANHLYSCLERHHGRGSAFLDTNPEIVPERLRASLRREIVNCEIFIAVVDPGWLCARLSDELDWVRVEIKEAQYIDKKSMLLLVGGAAMPMADDLPQDIRRFVEWRGFPAPNDEEIERFAREIPLFVPLRDPADGLRDYLHHVRSWGLNSYIPLNATRQNDPLRGSDVLTMLKSEIRKKQSSDIIVIVGGPESGRTVVLRQFAQSLIPRTNDTRPVPVWVDVKPYRATERFKDYLWRWLDSDRCPDFYESIRGSLQHYINSGQVLWLLDGMDAGSPEDFRRRLQQVWEFKNHRPANRCVLACRYDYELPNKDWPILLRLRELDDRQIDGFLRNVTGNLDLVKLKSRPDLLDSCRNPGGLQRLVTDWNRNGHLPSHLGHLYKEFLQDLIERAVPPGPEVSLVLDLLSKIALTMAEQGRNGSDIRLADLKTADLLRSPEDERRVESCVEGGLLNAETRTGSIGFVDHKFEDCLAARALEHRLMLTDRAQMIEKCLGDYVLRETLANAVTTSENANKLVDLIVNHALEKPQQIERILSAAECVQHASPAVREMYGFKLLPQLRKAASPYGRE